MDEVTQGMMDFANFMENYVEPAILIFPIIGTSIGSVILVLVNFVTTVLTLLSELAGWG